MHVIIYFISLTTNELNVSYFNINYILKLDIL